MGHSTMAKSQACLADSRLRSIPLGLGDSVSGSADCRNGTSCEARVVEAMGTRDDTAAAVCDGVDGKITGRCFELAPLHFVRIRVQGIEGSEISCLADSGSELNVTNSDVVSDLLLEPIGEVSLKGIIGRPVCAKLVQLHVQLADD
jgi:hypothetical protein